MFVFAHLLRAPMQSLLLAFSIGPVLLLAGAPAQAVEPVRVSLVAINDFHGNLLPPAGTVAVPAAGNPAGARVAAGGAAALAALVADVKSRNPGRTLLVGVGDLVGASPLASGLFHDEPTIEVLNQMGMVVSSVGNHEFDKGRNELLRLQNGGCHPRDANGSVGTVGVDTCMNAGTFAGAKFQYLAANVLDRSTGNTLFPATAVLEVGGVKIGFIGLTLRGTPSVVVPSGVVGLQFASEVATVNRLAPQLKAQGAAAVVVLLHQGGKTRARTLQDKTCPRFSGPVVGLADQFDRSVDVVLTGHTHQEYVCVRPNGLLVTQAGALGRMVTVVDLQIDAQARRVLAKDANTLVVQNTGSLPPDPAVQAIVQRYVDVAAPLADMEVGRLAAPLDRRTNAAGESSLGAVVADAYLAATSVASYGDRPAQIAFTNPGGLRSDLSAIPSVSFGQLFSVLPFNNSLVTMDLTGAQLLRLLEQQWERPQPPGGRVLPVSEGFGYTWDASQPEGAARGKGRRVVPGSMQLHGQPIAMEQSYRVTVNSFMAEGGDALNVFKQGRNVQEGDTDLAAARLHLGRQTVLQPPKMGRIQRLN